MKEKSDAELVDLARTGDKHAFGILIERYQGISIRVALRMVANEEIARELVQDALLQAFLSLDHLREGARFRNWLYGIVLNVCRNHIRSQKIEFFSLEALSASTKLLHSWEFPLRP